MDSSNTAQKLIASGRFPEDPSPLRHLPLVDLLVDTRTELFELAMRAGLRVFTTMLEEDRTAICGPRYANQPDRAVGRAGTVPSEVVLGGRKVAIQRPRVPSAAGEVPFCRRSRRWPISDATNLVITSDSSLTAFPASPRVTVFSNIPDHVGRQIAEVERTQIAGYNGDRKVTTTGFCAHSVAGFNGDFDGRARLRFVVASMPMPRASPSTPSRVP